MCLSSLAVVAIRCAVVAAALLSTVERTAMDLARTRSGGGGGGGLRHGAAIAAAAAAALR